jgi:hypothetical protein
MKKISLLFMAFLSFAIVTLAQSYEGTTQYDKKKQVAIVIDYAYPSQAVENAMIQRMEKLGYRAKEEKGILNRDKGVLVFKSAYVTDISKEKMDYIIKVDRKGKKENDESILYLILQKDGENAMDKLEANDIGKAKLYLNNMLPDIEAANLELQIKVQEEVVLKAEKKLKGLQDDKIELERKLAENAKSQDDTIKDIDAQKQSLEGLRGKRKKS